MNDKTFSQKFKRAGSIYFASTGVFWGIAGAIGVTGWDVLGISCTLAFVPLLIDFGVQNYKQRTLGKFFGLSNTKPIVNLALSTFLNLLKYDQETPNSDKNYRYYKNRGDKTFKLVGSKNYLSGFETASTGIRAGVELHKLTGAEIKVIADEREAEAAEGNPIICLGSSTSNNISDKVFTKISRYNFSVKFSTEKLECQFNDIGVITYSGDNEYDYAVLIRYEGPPLYFVCAGIDGEGTVATAHYLVENWKQLPVQTFMWVLKCYRNPPRVHGGGPIQKWTLNNTTGNWEQG